MNTTTSTLSRQLTDICGSANVEENAEAFAIQGHVPFLVVRPGSVEELAQAVAACHAARMAVVPYGGGTKQGWGRPPAAERFVAIVTTRLNRLLVYEPDDLTISVEAGITLQALDAALAANGQMLPLDGPWPARSTIGGVLATAVDGPRRLLYGTARDLLIGIRVVEASGRISKAGGMVVKNVSGFDMMKLYLGSLGTLGIIVSANFKLMPRPRAAATLHCAFDAPEPALRLAELIGASQLTPAGVVYVEGWAHDDGSGEAEGHATHPFALLVRAEGLPAAVERHLRDVRAMAEQAGAVSVTPHSDPAERQALDLVSDLAHPMALESGLALRLSCLPGSLADALADARSLAEQHGLTLRVVAYALSGVAYLRAEGEAIAAWHGALLARWPQLTVTAAPPALASELPVWGAPPANLELMRRIKQEFDPGNLLNPGRFVV